jgi:DNA repair protein RecN (Recombination protein N)
MLLELRIENFAIIDRLELTFTPGLITFTGETGAGKSIIIDAVETLMGGRAESHMIRAGAERANVEGIFLIPPFGRAPVQEILEREGLLDDAPENPGESQNGRSGEQPENVSLGREIRRSGRSVARVNGRSVNASLLNEIGEYLVDVHGQSEHLSLLRVRQHLRLLDNFAGVEDLLVAYGETYRRLQGVRREIASIRQAESDAARRADLLTYQINEIDAARLQPGEEEDLKEERNRLANAEGLAKLTLEALQIMDEGTPESPSITDLLGQLVRAINALARIDPAQEALSEAAGTIDDSLAELNRSLHNYQETIEFNPKRLDQVEERLNLISQLKRKYGISIQAVLAFAEEARGQLDAITHAGERILELEDEEARLLTRLGNQGQELSAKRRQAAENLAGAVEGELADLHMRGARFQVDFQQKSDPEGVPLEDGQRVAFDATGLERVEFLVAPNPGEGLKPLTKIASGGETSRLMLALKNVLARADQVPILIFDEIDQGIGGRVGTIVGRKLWSLARQHQVLCITHLPQLAAFGEQHYRVQKQVSGGRTHTIVELVQGEVRLLELAQMMGEVSEGTRRSAEELLESVTALSEVSTQSSST